MVRLSSVDDYKVNTGFILYECNMEHPASFSATPSSPKLHLPWRHVQSIGEQVSIKNDEESLLLGNTIGHFCREAVEWQAPVLARPGDRDVRGVFATRDVDAGDVVTFFPCDVLSRDSRQQLIYSNRDDAKNSQLARLSLEAARATCGNCFVSLGAQSGERSIGGDVSPVGCSEAHFLGHMANDGGTAPPSDVRDADEIELAWTAYNVSSQAASNAELCTLGSHMALALVASRPIQAGEEVFVTYGRDCWRRKLAADRACA